MSKYRPVDVKLWRDQKFLALGDDARLLWLFLLTGPNTLPIPGVIPAGPATLAEQLGWSVERFEERFSEVETAHLSVRRDGPLVWLCNATKYQRPANPNMIIGWAKSWDEVPEVALKREIWEALKIVCKGWDRTFAKQFREPLLGVLLEPLQKPLPEQLTPGTGTGTGTGTGSGETGALAVPQVSSWATRHELWEFLRATHRQLRDEGISPNSPDFAPQCAGELERLVIRCERHLAESGYSALEIPAKMRHVILIAATEARREQHFDWFKPAMIFEPVRFARALDTTLEQAAKSRKTTKADKAQWQSARDKENSEIRVIPKL